VQACNDAHIGLFDNYLDQEAYEIVIGGGDNLRSYVRRSRLVENKVSVSILFVLSGIVAEFVPFMFMG